MVMSGGNPKVPNLHFRGEVLAYVKSYKYLGLVISSNGSSVKMMNDRVTKTKRAMYPIRQAITNSHYVCYNKEYREGFLR